MLLLNWTEDQGLGVQLSYPEDLLVDLDDMMRFFTPILQVQEKLEMW